MKQFNLEEYLKNSDRQVVTRDGRSARIICTNRLDENYPVLALVNYEDYEMCHSYTTFGKLYINQTIDCELDLFFAPEKREVWVNIYKLGDKFIADEIIYNTKEEALHNKDAIMDYVGTFKLEFEEE